MATIQNIPKLRFAGFDGEWEKSILGDIGKIKMCKRVFNHETSETAEIPFYKIGTFGKVADAFITNEHYLDYKKRFSFPKPGEILLSAAGTLGRTVVYDGSPSYFQDSNIVWIANNEEFTKNSFLFYIYQIVRYDSEGGTIQRLYNSIISKTKFYNPCLSEQQKIASFLSAVDEKIQQLSRKKELLEQYKKGVMQQLFSGKLRFKDENGNDYADWQEKKLGEVCTNISYGMNAAATVYDGKNKYLRITDIDETSNGLNLDKPTSPNGLLEDKFRVKEGNVLFARTGASVGKSYLYRESDGILYFAGFLIRFHVKKAIPAFVYLQTQSSKYFKWVKVMSMRSGQPGINAEEYKTFEIPFPCFEEQQEIANFLSKIDVKIENTYQEIN